MGKHTENVRRFQNLRGPDGNSEDYNSTLYFNSHKVIVDDHLRGLAKQQWELQTMRNSAMVLERSIRRELCATIEELGGKPDQSRPTDELLVIAATLLDRRDNKARRNATVA